MYRKVESLEPDRQGEAVVLSYAVLQSPFLPVSQTRRSAATIRANVLSSSIPDFCIVPGLRSVLLNGINSVAMSLVHLTL